MVIKDKEAEIVVNVFPYDDERLTLYAVVGDVGYTGTLHALAAVAEVQAGDADQPADIRENLLIEPGWN